MGALNFKMAAPRFVNVFGEVMNALKNLIAKTTKDTGGTIFKVICEGFADLIK